MKLVEHLHADKSPQPPLPVQSHEERLNSGERGVSLAGLRGLRAFFAAHNRLDHTRTEVNHEGGETSVCALTRSTGLSLVESMVLVATE